MADGNTGAQAPAATPPSGETPPANPPGQPTPPTPPAPNPPTPPTPPPSQPAPGGGEGEFTGRAADRIRELNDGKTAAERERDEALERLKAIEEQNLSEKERAERRAAEAEERAKASDERADRLERTGWIRAHATGFANPQDAVEILDARLGDLDSEAKAKNAVEKLLEERPHLAAQAPPPLVPGFGTLGGAPGAAPVPVGAPAGEGGEMTSEQAKAGIASDLASVLLGRRRAG